MKPGNNNANFNETEILAHLEARLAEDVAWKASIEDLVNKYGDLSTTDVAGLNYEEIWKLWTASKFAETGSHSLPTPTDSQQDGLREMTRLLCERTKSTGDRFFAAKEACEKTFTTEHLQLPVILRTLLILERGRFGTVATKKHSNLLLKWSGKPELDYRHPTSITSALENVGKLMHDWAERIGVESISDTARIPWYLCEILNKDKPVAGAGNLKSLTTLQVILRRYCDERIVFLSSAEMQRYAISSVSTEAADVKRLDANEPQRITFDQAEKLVEKVKQQGSLDFADLNHTAAIRNVVLQSDLLALSGDRKRIIFLDDKETRLLNFCEVLTAMKRQNNFYKPVMLLCVLDGIDNGNLLSNQITFDWIAPRFILQLNAFGQTVNDQHVAQPFFYLSSDLFWLHAVSDFNDLMEGGDGAGAARTKIKYALFKEPYWDLLQDPTSRRAIRHHLEKMIMLTPSQLLSAAYTAIANSGFKSPNGLVGRFLSALAAKPFVILTGNSGTGKTQLAKLIAEWLSPGGTTVQHADPFRPGAVIESDRIKYFVNKSDSLSVEFWNGEQENEVIKVSLPRQMIREWADVMRDHNYTQDTKARTIREAVSPQSRYSAQLHSFETHLKAAALALLNAESAPTGIQPTTSAGFVLVPVGADWTDNRNIVGFVNHLRKDVRGIPMYQSTPVLELLLRATADPAHPYFLILDEMNLSHVERYFSDFLSAMESSKPIPLHQEACNLLTPSGASVCNELSFPENLFIIGTVNVDETTYMFSPKVLDRANVIEFRIGIEQARDFLSQNDKHISSLPSAFGAPLAFLDLSHRARGAGKFLMPSPSDPTMVECRQTLEGFFELLHEVRLEFAFRTIAEIMRYLHVDFEFAADKEQWRWQDCMDAQVLQKILPKLHGSRRRIEAILVALATYCEKRSLEASGKYLLRDAELISFPAPNPPGDVAFPLSRSKLLEMIVAVRRDQFVSFI